MARSSAVRPASQGVVRASWLDICRTPWLRGRWVALDNVRYCPMTSEPLEADVVDADDDLASLCLRMRESDRHACCVLHCSPGARAATASPARRPLH